MGSDVSLDVIRMILQLFIICLQSVNSELNETLVHTNSLSFFFDVDIYPQI